MDIPEELPVAGTVVLVRQGDGGLEVLLMRRPERGSFAGAWVFPGGKVEDVDRMAGASEAEDARRAGVRETFEEVGLEVGELVELSCWTPPAGIPRRIRAWFFVARDPGGEVRAAPAEVAAHLWITPAEALERHAAGEWTLFPPTWMTLHSLLAVDEADAVLAGDVRRYDTRIDGTAFLWEGMRLETSGLPWRLAVE